ncbi:phosphatidylinositol 4-phosphate 3-kinase C2 domain-containing subunit alpha isoform X4 [Turdus rufiventris]|nr:phosphatidylinositol 4-phosphate 3-kinase C2 domain-containing subunit alpha isoform X4 [Turdus rufiventris]
MAQISSSNGFKQRSSPSLSAPRSKDVDKEEALQMEAEALAKMQKERGVAGNKQTFHSLSSPRQKAQTHNKQDHDLMVFPESDAKSMEDKLSTIDIDKLTHAELEKLLLDDNFESNKVPTLPASPILSPSLSSQFYLGPTGQRRQWTPGVPAPVTCTLPPIYTSASYTKQTGVFQNGFHPSMSSYPPREPIYLGLPRQSQYISYPLAATTPFHPHGGLPLYPVLTPEMAKVFDKIASTSEFLRNGKSSTDLEMTSIKSAVSNLPASESCGDVSKFDWLDLDPLSKPKVDTVETLNKAEDDGERASRLTAEDPWDAVLLEEKLPNCHLERKVNGKSSGATVTRSQSLNMRTTQLAKLQGQTSQKDNGTTGTLTENVLLQAIEGQNQELSAFSEAVTKLRTKFPYTDQQTNPGFVLSPIMLQRNISGESASIKVSIEIEEFQQPVTFTCDVSSPVELIIMQALCWVHDDLNEVDIGSYILKVCGQEEVLQNKHCIGSHEYIQNCRKWDTDIKLQLLTHSGICSDLARTEDDDRTPIHLTKHLYKVEKPFREPIIRSSIEELLEVYHKQVNTALKNGVSLKCGDDNSKSPSGSLQPENPLKVSIDQLTRAVEALLQLHTNSCSNSAAISPEESKSTKEAWTATEHLQFTIFAAHGISSGWVSNYEKYYLICSLTHNGKDLFKPVQSKKVGTYKSFFYLIKWDELEWSGKTGYAGQIDFPSHAFDIEYKMPQAAKPTVHHSVETLEKPLRERLLAILSKDSTIGFADQEVRNTAVKWIETLSDDELTDFLPQFVQALKYETHLDSALVKFLLARALGSIRIAHYLYWLLKDTLYDTKFGVRYEQILGAFLSVCGKRLREELEKQTRLVQLFGMVAEKVKQTSGSARQVALQNGMERVQLFFLKNKCRLPLNPSLVAKELNIKTLSPETSNPGSSKAGHYSKCMKSPVCISNQIDQEYRVQAACSFFSSNAVPLKVALINADPLGEEINVMFKVGEDLRQDMLALQMIKIMDKIWLQEGLDLRMVIFKCLSTGKDRGMVELVPASDTLRKIQVEYGVTGSFKDKPLAEWLRKYNPTEEEYEKASENFIYSCAGCCVATYVLGICDRHNDNIMLRNTGHMFHIDFGKFLGHAQMFGSFKRDRAPFVLTSDMAYVINGGEKPTIRFQLFVDLCCQAYNLIRKHASLFLNLLSLMLSSGLPELSGVQDLKYVQDALQPQTTDAEATIFFTRLIESSLGSVATKFNFFIHNLAQLRFSGLPSNDEPILSFSAKTYSLKQDGRIKQVSVFTYQKRYNPDKHYIYVVRVLREGQVEPTFVFRTFDEFQELHNKLGILFPLWKLPGFPNKMVLGRTHIKDVAAKRKVELNSYIQSLMNSSPEVAECDLVYTFFHPLLRDDKVEGIDGIARPADTSPASPTSGKVGGEVKLSISYRNSTLFVMVMHIKDLVTEDGADPNPYVKTYLLPDTHKTSKRKTKISRKTRNPTFNEMANNLYILKQGTLHFNRYIGPMFRKGLSQSALPYRRSVPTWLKLTSDDVKEQIYKLAKKGLTPSQIGVILRDSHGVAQVRFVTGNKILRILKSKGLAPDLPEDLYHLIKKAVAVRKHLERNRKDKDAKFRLILIESRIHRLARYYKTKRVLPPNWKYESSTASALVA